MFRDSHAEITTNFLLLLFYLSNIIQNHVEEIKKDIPVVIYCRKGVRSMIAIQKLEQKYPFDNLLNLTGGMEEWKKMVNQ